MRQARRRKIESRESNADGGGADSSCLEFGERRYPLTMNKALA
jgi:hypothetical protein